MRIALWDTNLTAVAVLRRSAANLGIEFALCDSLEELCDRLRASEVDLVVAGTCVGVEGLAELVAARECARPERTKVLWMLERFDQEQIARAVAMGVDDFLPLPLTFNKVGTVLWTHFSRMFPVPTFSRESLQVVPRAWAA